jgi:hypothetical protein
MRAIFVSGQGEVTLNYMWLPTWIGMNRQIKADIEKDLTQKMCGIEMSEDGLDRAHDIVVEYLTLKFGDIRGLRDYLDAMKFVETPKAP